MILCSWIKTVNIVKMSVLPILIYIFNLISIKISTSYLWIATDFSKVYLKQQTSLKKGKIPRITNTILNEKNKVGGLTLLNFKIYDNTTVNKEV